MQTLFKFNNEVLYTIFEI